MLHLTSDGISMCIIVIPHISIGVCLYTAEHIVKIRVELQLLIGETQVGLRTIQLTYGLGMAIGITAFYNHFGKKKNENEPTPIELKMKQYENDIQEYMKSEKEK